jgi:hypothetical protein
VLADLLDDPRQLAPMVGGAEVVDAARATIEAGASAATEVGGWTADDPLRLSKGPITWLLRCPRRAVANPDDAAPGNPDDLAIGLLVDAGAKLATLGASPPITAERALDFCTASGDTSARDHLDLQSPAAAEALLAEAQVRIDLLTGLWPTVDGAWWPRVEEPVRARLASGAVVFSGRLDVLLGGPPTDRPALVVEIKSGRWHDGVRSDAHLYGLLLGLRDGIPPAAVLSIAARDGTTQLEPMRPDVLHHAAERVAVALHAAARLAAGEPPEARPGNHCTHCPLQPECPEGRTFTARAAAA